MTALLRQLAELCLMRRGPQDLPYSPAAVAAFAIALLALQGVVGHANQAPFQALLARIAVSALMLFGVTVFLLRQRGYGNRLVQTLLAQAGAGLLFTLLMLPAAMALRPYVRVDDPPAQAMLPATLALVLFVWKLRVDAWIWRHALDLPRLRALALAVLLVLVELLLLVWLAPPVPAATA